MDTGDVATEFADDPLGRIYAGVASADSERDRALRDVSLWAARVDFVTFIGEGPRKAGRDANAKILARLGLHLCFDAALYPFRLCEIQALDHVDDVDAALAFLAEQAGAARSRWEAEDLEQPNSELSRLCRMAG